MSVDYRVFIGYDPRQPIAYNVAQFAVAKNASKPVSITPLILSQLPIERRGLTEFTFTRFLVPWLCEFKGKALFMDPDMIVTGDVCDLIDSCGCDAAVHVVKDQPKFEWASMMVFCNARCRDLTPEFVDDEKNQLFDMAWSNGEGDISRDWNYCIGYSDRPDDPKLYHYTQGIPCWPETVGVEDEPWFQTYKELNSTVSWKDLMGPSIHAKPVVERLRANNA